MVLLVCTFLIVHMVTRNKLGRWIERLRAFYNGNPKIKVALTQTGIAMLEKIGMVWKLENRYPWPEWYLQCRLYYAANGDLLVPKMYKNEQFALGNWIGEQRKKYKKGTLKPEQVEALEKVGMVWELVDRDIWEKRYNDAYAYYNEHGNIDVSPNVLTAGNMYLRDWLIAQKSLYQESNCETDLDWERHDLLDDIGMDWEKQVGRKSYSYAYRAQRYYNEFGNLDVPEDYNDMMGGNLHEWVKRQWRLYHRPTTDKSDAYISKKKELENLGFDWNCEGRWDWDAKEATWLQNYNGIKAYVDANGCLPIGESSIPLTTSVNSEFWIAAQKAAIRNGMMNEDKQQMLASIGVVYGQFKRNDDWQENYNFVKAYYKKHKRLPIGVNRFAIEKLDDASMLSTVFIIWVILLALPLFSELEFLGVKVKKEVKKAVEKSNEEVKASLDNLQQIVSQIQISNSVAPQFTINGGSLPSEERMDNLIKEIHLLNEQNTNKQTEKQDKVNIPAQNLELFKMRYGIETKLNDAMGFIGYNGKNHISLVQSAYYLSRQGVLDPKCIDLLIQVVRIANRGVHGEIVDQKYFDFASEAYPKIIDALDDCKELIKKMT